VLIRVSQDGLRITGWNAKILEQRPDRVTQVMNLDSPDLVVVADAAEGPDQIARLDRPPGPGSEDEARVGPGLAHVGLIGSLSFTLELERLANDIQDWQASLPGAGLDRREQQPAAGSKCGQLPVPDNLKSEQRLPKQVVPSFALILDSSAWLMFTDLAAPARPLASHLDAAERDRLAQQVFAKYPKACATRLSMACLRCPSSAQEPWQVRG
jgi:hypothetical protein